MPDPTDVPYSGILLGSVATELAADDNLYGLKVTGGVRGPASLGEHVQKAIHRLTGSQPPQGWSQQSQNELILNVTYEQRRRFAVLRSDSGWELQAIPLVAGSLGNAVVEGQLDGQVRVGFNLPDDFGVTGHEAWVTFYSPARMLPRRRQSAVSTPSWVARGTPCRETSHWMPHRRLRVLI